RVAERREVRVNENDTLLAVIHGFGSSGWRHSQATQTYVLKDNPGGPIRALGFKRVLADHKNGLPRIRGDVIEQDTGQPGFFYYNGAKYGWYDPLTYKSSPQPKLVHGQQR